MSYSRCIHECPLISISGELDKWDTAKVTVRPGYEGIISQTTVLEDGSIEVEFKRKEGE